MGKRRGAGAGNGGGKRAGPASSSSDTLVVINPAMLQAAGARKPDNSQQRANKSKKKSKSANAKPQKASGKASKKRPSEGAGAAQPRKKRAHDGAAAVVANVAVSSATRVSRAQGGDAWTSVLRVKTAMELLAGVYWTLLTRGKPRCSVVALPTHAPAELPTPQELAAMLKHLGLQSVALHRKMTAGQRHESVTRLATSASAASVASPAAHRVVLVTTEHLLASAACQHADVILLDASDTALSTAASRFAHVYHVTSAPALATGEVSSTTSAFRPELQSTSTQQLQARLKLARQLVATSQRVARAGGAQDGDAKWARKLAKGADLDDDDDDEPAANKRKRVLSPDEQRLQALTEKLYLLVSRPLAGSTSGTKAHEASQQVDGQHGREKLEVLGLVTLRAAVGAAMGDERTAAQTQWLDGAPGRAFGGEWDGAVRFGAAKDATSLALRRELCATRTHGPDAELASWQPNAQPADEAQWGGAFGKACAHNEVVLQALRPFFPQLVLNSKVCSKLHPAPGNQGFDGCLEHLRLRCVAQRRPMTLWDAEFFVFLSSRGRVHWAPKRQLLSLSLAGLQCLVPALRRWTVACEGRLPPPAVLRAVQLCCALGSGDKRSGDARLAPATLKRVVSFAFGGSARLWRQIAKARLELESVY